MAKGIHRPPKGTEDWGDDFFREVLRQIQAGQHQCEADGCQATATTLVQTQEDYLAPILWAAYCHRHGQRDRHPAMRRQSHPERLRAMAEDITGSAVPGGAGEAWATRAPILEEAATAYELLDTEARDLRATVLELTGQVRELGALRRWRNDVGQALGMLPGVYADLGAAILEEAGGLRERYRLALVLLRAAREVAERRGRELTRCRRALQSRGACLYGAPFEGDGHG